MRMILVLLLMLMIQPFAYSQQRDSTKVRDTLPGSKTSDTLNRTKIRDTVQMGGDKKPEVIITADTVIKGEKKDSVRKHSPRKASLRSAILPGWGQIYNKKYWKLPLVYAGIGIPGYLIYYNKNWYDRSRYALAVASSSAPTQDSLNKVHPQLLALTSSRSVDAIRNYRNEFRKNMDYSILITLLFWGLNVIDATVDAHLKDFDVSDKISMRIKPVILTGTRTPALSFVFNFHDKEPRPRRSVF